MSEQRPRRRSAGELQHQAEHTRPTRHVNVLGYLAILFAVAFLLLGFAYLQQQRINKETTDALKDSSSAVQTIQNVMAENEALRDRVEDLTEENTSLDTTRREQDSYIAQLEEALENTRVAMDYFWQVDEAYVRGRYGLCRDLMKALEDDSDGKTPLKTYLPGESATDTDRYSPADRYAEIYKALH